MKVLRVIPKNVKKIEKHDFQLCSSCIVQLDRLNYLHFVYTQLSFKISKHGCGGPFYDNVSTVIWHSLSI